MSSLPVGFLAARMLVSGSLSMAAQASPDLLHAAHRTPAEAAALAARIDMLSALSQFALRPLWGSAIDSLGRKPVLVIGCFLSFVARATAANMPESAEAYLFYRILNVNAVMPVMQASNALLADACGGRQSDLYIKMNRRLFMVLAMCRILATRFAASRATKGDSPAKILNMAARAILMSGIIFSLTVKETLKHDSKVRFSATKALRSSAVFFLQSKRRLLLALALIIRLLPMFSASCMMALQKYDYGWGASERALFSNVSDAADVLCPLMLDEILQIKPKKGREALVWAGRFSALALLNIAVTPFPKSILFNTILERLVSSQPWFDEVLERERVLDGTIGEGLLNSAVSTLEFPVGMIIPPMLMKISGTFGYRAPYYLLTLCLLFNSEVMSHML